MNERVPHRAQRASEPPRNILVVDDDPLVRILVRETLGRASEAARVHEAPDLAAARARLSESRYDCVVLDLGLPDGDGSEILSALSGPERPAVVVLTGEGERSMALRMLRGGVEDFLEKQTVDGPAIRRAVAYAMERHATRMAAEAEADALKQLAEVDPLTELPNRRGLARSLQHLPRQPRWGVLFDADDFKRVNDVYGHSVGDAVLKAVGSGLGGACRPGDLAARIGGDEFLAVFPADGVDAALAVAERWKASIDQALARVEAVTEARDVVTVSAGLADLTDASELDTMIARCTQPLHISKTAGKDRIAVGRARATRPLAEAVDALSVELRPVLEAATGRTVGVEAVMGPGSSGSSLPELLGEARAAGRLAEIEATLVMRRVEAVLDHPSYGGVILPLLLRTATHWSVLDQLDAANEALGPGRLVVALWGDTGTMEGEGFVDAQVALERLGVRVGVSRLGRGSTPVEAITALRPTLLRLDGDLVRGIATDERRARRVGRFAKLGEAMGASVLAPRVASPADRRLLAMIGVRLITEGTPEA